MGESGGSRIKS